MINEIKKANIQKTVNGKNIPMGNKPTIGTKIPMAIGKNIPVIINTNINNKDHYFSLIKELNKKYKLLLCQNGKVSNIFDLLKEKDMLNFDYLSFVAEKYDNLKSELRAGKFILALENEFFEDEWIGERDKNTNNNSTDEESNETKKVKEYILKLPEKELEQYKKLALKQIPEEIRNNYFNNSDELKYKLSKIKLNEEVFNLVKEEILIKA